MSSPEMFTIPNEEAREVERVCEILGFRPGAVEQIQVTLREPERGIYRLSLRGDSVLVSYSKYYKMLESEN